MGGDPVCGPSVQTPSDFPPHVLREYALVADGERGALIGPHGDLVWMCAPRWDSDAVFSSLVGGRGGYSVTPLARHVWGGYYEEGTLIWRSRWVVHGGAVECREALAFPGDSSRAVLLRRVVAVDIESTVRVMLEPRAGFGEHDLTDLQCRDGVWTGRTGGLRLRWSGAPEATPHAVDGGAQLCLELTLAPGEHRDLVLEIGDRDLPEEPVEAGAAWIATEDAWRRAVPTLHASLAPRDTRHSYAVLRGLTSSGGGMVAAATTSLPERAGAGRNYDYRYVWIRDQCYAGRAAAMAGGEPLLDDAVRFVSGRLLEHGDQLAPAYTTTGERVPDQRRLDLPGYPGGRDLVGNWVNQQFQLDAFGEALLLLATAADQDRLDADGWRAAQVAADAIGTRWTEPDAGVWEVENRAWTHSRLICAAGLRAMAAADGPAQTGAWLALADRIVSDTAAHATHPSGRWQRAADDPRLDGALLLPALRGALPAHDPRSVLTLEAYLAELTRDGYAYRFRHDDRPLSEAEGAFLLCGFITALATEQQGRHAEAIGWFERTRAACGPPMLYAEEFDVVQHQLRGNVPQAFVHALMIEASVRLAAYEG